MGTFLFDTLASACDEVIVVKEGVRKAGNMINLS